MLRAVLFDFDGVIADSEALHLEGFRHALAAEGMRLGEAEYYERYVGFDDRDGFAAILADRGRTCDAALVASLCRAKESRFAALARERVRLFPGVRELLESLGGDGAPGAGVAVGIVSGALRSEIELVLDTFSLAGFIDTIVAAGEISGGKPAPDGYLEGARKLDAARGGVCADACVVIEDTPAGLAAAHAAGMVTVAVTNTHSAGQLSADLTVSTVEALDRDVLDALLERSRREKSHG